VREGEEGECSWWSCMGADMKGSKADANGVAHGFLALLSTWVL